MGSPAPSVFLTPLTRDLAALVGSWFAEDDEGSQRLDAGFYGVDLMWWLLVEQSAVRHGWIGRLDDEGVGFADVEIDGDRGDIAIYVRRAFRGRGIGRQLLSLTAAEARSLGIAELVGHVESDNVASVRCLLCRGVLAGRRRRVGPGLQAPVAGRITASDLSTTARAGL